MTQAIVFSQTGGPEVLGLQSQTLGAPGPGQVRVRHTAIGINFIDTYQRSGLYPLPLPSGLGQEAAGVVEALGPEVSGLAVGDRVAYAGGPLGAYSTERLLPAAVLVKIPDGISDESAACMMLQGMTVEYLVQRTYPVRPGQTVLWHAAAGGVGQIAVQWLTALGATVIGTVVPTPRPTSCAAWPPACDQLQQRGRGGAGARDHRRPGRAGGVRLGGQGYLPDLAGLPEPARHAGQLRQRLRRGAAVRALELTSRGSLFFTRPKLADYVATRAELEASAQALFERVADGRVKVAPSHRYPWPRRRRRTAIWKDARPAAPSSCCLEPAARVLFLMPGLALVSFQPGQRLAVAVDMAQIAGQADAGRAAQIRVAPALQPVHAETAVVLAQPAPGGQQPAVAPEKQRQRQQGALAVAAAFIAVIHP